MAFRTAAAHQPREPRVGHAADAEIHWPSLANSPFAGQIWAIEVELTPDTVARTTGIMTELLTPMRYTTVVYMTAPAARQVVLSAADRLPPRSGPGSWSGTWPDEARLSLWDCRPPTWPCCCSR